MSFTIKFENQKEHDDYCVYTANKLENTKTVNASDVLNKKAKPTLEDNKYSSWTTDEDNYILAHYKEMNPKKIAKILGRTSQSIVNRAYQLRKQGKPVYRYELPVIKAHDRYLKQLSEEQEIAF